MNDCMYSHVCMFSGMRVSDIYLYSFLSGLTLCIGSFFSDEAPPF